MFKNDLFLDQARQFLKVPFGRRRDFQPVGFMHIRFVVLL
jgi:hypothetical protein